MKILVLSKRQYMGKDIIDDEYGRFYSLPMGLASLGHEVRTLCWSYQKKPECAHAIKQDHSQVIWQSINLGRIYPVGILRYLNNLKKVIDNFKPDIVWACSDAFHAIIGGYVESRYKIPCVVDLYDNFESFGATSIPGVKKAFIRSVSSISGITCASDSLKSYISEEYKPSGYLATLTNAIPDNMFYPMDKLVCRNTIGLPSDATIIGTAGALAHSRDITRLFDAFKQLQYKYQKLHLALAGPIGKDVALPDSAKVTYLGNLDYQQIPTFFNSLDIAVICNLNNSFGKYCFPQKFYEINACKTPVIAAATGDISKILKSYPNLLYPPGDSVRLSQAISYNIKSPSTPNIPSPTWYGMAIKLQSYLQRISNETRLSGV